MLKDLSERKLVRYHGHCANVLMKDYGVPKELRVEVCRKIGEIWEEADRFHDLIIHAVRGCITDPATRPLKNYLIKNGTRQPENPIRQSF